jgi:hypothetical protein
LEHQQQAEEEPLILPTAVEVLTDSAFAGDAFLFPIELLLTLKLIKIQLKQVKIKNTKTSTTLLESQCVKVMTMMMDPLFIPRLLLTFLLLPLYPLTTVKGRKSTEQPMEVWG